MIFESYSSPSQHSVAVKSWVFPVPNNVLSYNCINPDQLLATWPEEDLAWRPEVKICV